MDKLTKEQIDVMPAGREMDALVAELVMEWERITKWHGNPLAEGWTGFWDGTWFVWIERPEPEDSGESSPWQPSTDIVAVWQVMDKFDRTEWDIQIVSDTQDEGKVWGISFCKYTDKLNGIVAMGSAACSELPHAISRAALKAKLNEINNG